MTAETGAKGLEHAKSSEFDVILTDLNLPDINGIEMVRQSKMISPETEIIIVTGYDKAEKAIEATRVGAFGYRVKPLNFEDLMLDINRQTDSSNMIWKLVDKETGAVNHEIAWTFKLDERVKIRLVNEMEGSDHPMHHPFHVHGAGRFLILSRDGRPEDNLVWKDTVLVPAGHTIDNPIGL